MQPFAPLRFYTALEAQHRNRPWTNEYGDQHLIMSQRNIIPFIVKKALNNANTPTVLRVWMGDTGWYWDAFSDLSGDFLTLHDTDTNERWHCFKSLLTITWPTPGDDIELVDGGSPRFTAIENFLGSFLYIELRDGSETWYSETFMMNDFDENDLGECDYLKLEYTATCRVGDIPYDLGAPGMRMFLDTSLGRPEYQYTEEVEEDGQRNRVVIFQRAEKLTKLEVSVPEYQADALSLLPLHNVIIITDKWGEVFSITTAEFSASWETNGALCDVTLDLLLSASLRACC